MAAFGSHFAVAFQADLQAIFAKRLNGDTEEILLSEFCDQDRKSKSNTDSAIYGEDDGVNDKDDDDEDEHDVDDDDGEESDASGPTSSYLRDLSGECSVSMEEDAQDAESAPVKNYSYTLSELTHYTEDEELIDSETEDSISDQDSSMENLQYECSDSKKRICNTTFVVDKSKSSPYPTQQGLSQFYKKPVSVVQPITSSDVQLSDNTSPSKDDHLTSPEFSGKLDLAQAVLCSRNKIALALAEQLHVRPSQVVSDESTGHTGGMINIYYSDEEESCSTYPSSEETCYPETGVKRNIKSDEIHRQQFEASMKKRALGNIGNTMLGLETGQPECYPEDQQPPYVRRRSLKITPSFLDHVTKSSPHSVKLENSNFDMERVNSSSTCMKRQSAPLCALGGPMKSKSQGINVNSGMKGLPIMFSGSKARGSSSGHQSIPLVQRPVSPAQQSSCSNSKTRRRSSQVLRVNEGTVAIESRSSVEKKGTLLEHHKESCAAHLGNGGAFLQTPCFTTQLSPFSLGPAKEEGVDKMNYKRKLLEVNNPCRPRSHKESIPDNRACLQSRGCPVKSLKKQEAAEEHSEDAMNYKRKLLEVDNPFRTRSHKDCIPEDRVGLQSGSAVNRLKNPETAEEHSEDTMKYKRQLLEVDDPFRTRSHKESITDKRAGLQSTGNTLNSLKKKETAEEEGVDTINYKKKLLEVNNPSRTRSHLESIPDNRVGLQSGSAVNSFKKQETAEKHSKGTMNYKRKLLQGPFRMRSHKESAISDNRAGLQSVRAVNSLKQHASSPSGSSRNSIVLSGGHESRNSPLGPNVRKRARESVAMDTADALPTKHAKRGSPLSSYPGKNMQSLQPFSWWGKESTPMKGRDVQSLQVSRFHHQNSKPMSPIRRASGDSCGSVRDAVVSPCKGSGSCDKSFCFDCC